MASVSKWTAEARAAIEEVGASLGWSLTEQRHSRGQHVQYVLTKGDLHTTVTTSLSPSCRFAIHNVRRYARRQLIEAEERQS